MSSDIQQLTNRLLAALNSNYEVVDTSAVLLVISQLEQTTITKEQLEATRLGKYINLLRRRTWSESLARRAKNLLKKWRNMVITPAGTSGLGMGGGGGATSGLSQQSSSNQNQIQSQSESQSMTTTTMPPQHHHHNHNHQIHHVSLSQPTSPAIQLSDNNQKSSRHYLGQPRNIENSSLPEYPCSGSRSSSISKNVPSTSKKSQQQRNQQNLINLSNGGHQQQHQQQQSQQSQGSSNKAPSGKGIFSKSSIKSPQTKRQPISFANLIESQLHPPGGGSGGGGGGGGGGAKSGGSHNRTVPGPSSFLVDDNRSQSPLTLPRIPRISRDRQTSSPMIIDHSVSPLDLDQNSNPSREDGSSHVNLNNPSVVNPSGNVINNNTISICSRLINGDYGGASIDLNDSNSNSNMIGTLRESVIEVHRFLDNRSSEHRKSKKHKKDKRRHKQDRLPSDDKLNVRNDQNQLLSDETQICGGSNNNSFPIQETLSLSNSSLSRFPSTSTNITITASSNRGIINNSGKKIESDLTFAGKFKKTQSPIASSIIQIQKSPKNVVDGMMIISDNDRDNIQNLEDGTTQNLVGNGQDAAAAAAAAASATYQTVINPAKKSKRNDGHSSVVVIESRSCSPFTPIRGNSNDSTSSSSRNSGQDLIEVVNNDSERNDFIQNRLIAATLPSHQTQQQHHHLHHQKQPPPQQPLLQTQTAPPGHHLKTPVSEAPEAPVPKENKVPKRRGRKKGSKGADAMLAQFNNQLFEGSKLLSLASLSSCKKVKTTKELLADIQNRKLESTASSPTLTFQSRPPSTSSEPSLHSASTSDACSTNATISTVARSTPDKNIVLVAPFRPSGVDEDSGSNLSGSGLVAPSKKEPHTGDVKSHHGRSKGDEVTTSIEDDIRRLMSSLPIINRDKIDWGMGDEIICTCTIKEIEPQLEPDGVVLEKDEDDDEGGGGGGGGGGANDGNVGDVKFQVVVKPPQNEIRSISKPDGGISVKVQRSPSPGKVKMPQKPIKSIFDLDYDEENDPLRSFVEAAKTVRVETSTDPIQESEFPEKEDDRNEKIISVSLPAQLPKSDVISFPGEIQSIPPQQPTENVPQFEVVEDPNCPARQRYEIQTNCITKFHVHTLHNRYVPGVNGNWDESDCGTDDLDTGSEMSPDGLYERVVPQYNFLIMDKIPKDLSHVTFSRNYQRLKQLKEARRRSQMKRKRSESMTTTNAVDDGGGDLKHLKTECPSHDLDEIKDIVTVDKREMDDGFDSNMNLSNCSDKAAVICSPELPMDGSTDDDRIGVMVGGIPETERLFPPIIGNQTSNSGSRGSSSCSNSSVNLSNTLSCSNNGGMPNITVSHNVSNNIEESGDNSVEENCSEYRGGDEGDDDEVGIYYDDDDDDDEEDDDDDEEEDDEDEDHGKFQVQVVEPESTWSTSTVGNKLVLTLKKTPISLSFKCTDKAGTSKNNNKRDNIEIEVSDSNDNEMAVAPDTVDSLSNNVPSSGWNERVTSVETPTATTVTTETTAATTAETTVKEEEGEEEEGEGEEESITKTDKAAETIVSKISITEISMDEDNLSIELRDLKKAFIKDNNFGDPKNISEINDKEVYNDFEVIKAVCSSPELSKNYKNDDEIKLKLNTDQLNDDDSSGSISIHAKFEDENVYDDDPILPEGNNELLPSFNCLDDSNRTGRRTDSNTGKPQQFKEWHEVLQVRSYNDELLTILPYVVID